MDAVYKTVLNFAFSQGVISLNVLNSLTTPSYNGSYKLGKGPNGIPPSATPSYYREVNFVLNQGLPLRFPHWHTQGRLVPKGVAQQYKYLAGFRG